MAAKSKVMKEVAPSTEHLPTITEPRSPLDDYVDHGLQIVVLTQGFVYIGFTRVNLKSNWVIIHGVKNIRQWGTSEGLGELCIKGPQSGTILDRVGAIAAPMGSVVSLLYPQTNNWPDQDKPQWQVDREAEVGFQPLR